MGVLLALPEAQLALGQVRDYGLGLFNRLSTGEKALSIGFSAMVAGTALTPLLADPQHRAEIFRLLDGRIYPIPFTPVSVELNLAGDNFILGFHLDVGKLLPPSLGFGAGLGGSPLRGPQPVPPPMFKKDDGAAPTPEPVELRPRIEAARSGGAPLDQSLRRDLEGSLGADLSGVRVHTDAESETLARSVHARAFTTGQDIFFGSARYNPHSEAGRELLAHETLHTVQQAMGAVAGPANGISVNAPGDLFEQEADRFAGGFVGRRPAAPPPPFLRNGTASPPTGAIQRIFDGPTPAERAQLAELDRRAREEEEQERARHEQWQKSHKEQFSSELLGQSKTLGQERETSAANILAQRGKVFQAIPAQLQVAKMMGWKMPNLPPDLQQRWSAARQSVEVVATEISLQEVQSETQDEMRPVFSGYFLALLEFAADVEQAQSERQAASEKRYEEQLRLWELQRDSMQMGDLGAAGARGGWNLMNPRPARDYTAPEPVSPGIRPAAQRVEAARTAAEWQQVLNDFDRSTTAMDGLLLYLLPENSDARQSFEYFRDVGGSLEKLEREHPLAVRIPAVFYPKDQFVTIPGEGGRQVEVAKGIPWQFYLYHTGVTSRDKPATSGGEWVLVDLTSPQQYKANKEDSSDFDALRLQQGDTVDPPIELFKVLNSRLRFPKGQLYWQMPSGQGWTLETTERWSLSDWLKAIGMALAVIALIAGVILTAGLAAPAAVPAITAIATAAGIGAAAFNIGGTLAELHEKREHGMLTSEDVNRAVLSIAIDIASALSLGLGRIAGAATEAAMRGGQIGRYVILLRGAARATAAVATAGNIVNVGIATVDFIRAYRAIKDNPNLSDPDKEKALSHLVGTGLLTLAFFVAPMVGEVLPGKNIKINSVDSEGRFVVGPETETPRVPEADTPGARPRTPEEPSARAAQTGAAVGPAAAGAGGAPATGWSRRGLLAPEPAAPRVDPKMPSEKVEIRIQRDESGLVSNIEVWHGENAHPRDIKIHEDVANLVRRYGGQIGRIPKALANLERAFGGDPPPLELQMELHKLQMTAAKYQEQLTTRKASEAEVQEMEARLHLIDHEIGNVEAAIADPGLRARYPEGRIGLPVKPTDTPGLPDPPAGHHYYMSPHTNRWELRRNANYAGPRFDVEYANGVPQGRATNAYEVERVKNRPYNDDTRAALDQLGYRIDKNGVIYRPAGHAEAGKPHMEPLEVVEGRIQIAKTESLGEQQARVRASLTPDQTARLQAQELALAPGEKLRLVEGIHDTGATWAEVLTPQRRAQLRAILLNEKVPAQDVDRLIDGLVNKPGTLKVVFGTDPVRRAVDYRAKVSAPTGDVHHGDPLYLGGGHRPEMLFDLPDGPHDKLHDFFDTLTLPPKANPPGAVLEPSALQARVKATAQVRPGAAIIAPDGSVRYVFLDQPAASAATH